MFPPGVLPNLHVVTQITGRKDGPFDRAINVERRETYVTGPSCIPIINTSSPFDGFWIAEEILAPLNGYAVLADSNFKPVTPVAISWKSRDGSGGMTFGSSSPNRPTRLIMTNRHPKLRELLPRRVAYMTENPLAAYAAAVLAAPPSWADYYRLLEDIARRLNTSLARLDQRGVAKRTALGAFRLAANNRAFGRHGDAQRNTNLAQEDMMNLLEAREFVRGVVSSWLDLECGDYMPRDRVDGGSLRFGLDDDDE